MTGHPAISRLALLAVGIGGGIVVYPNQCSGTRFRL